MAAQTRKSKATSVLGIALSAVLMCGCTPLQIGPITLDPTPVADFFSNVGKGISETFHDVVSKEAEKEAVVELKPSVEPPVIAKEGVLTIGITPTTLPFTYSASTGELSGLDIDVAAALAEELGLHANFVEVSSGSDAVAQGVDVYIATTATGSPEMVICGTYEESASALFRSGKGDTATITELTGSTVGVQSGSNSASVFSKMVLDATEREYDSLNDAFSALSNGSVDFVLCDAYMGAFIARGDAKVSFAGTVTEAVPMGVAVDAENPELQVAVREAMEKLASNGRMALLRKRWVGELPTLSEELRVSDLTVASGARAEDVALPAETQQPQAGDGTTAGANAVTLDDATAESSEELGY